MSTEAKGDKQEKKQFNYTMNRQEHCRLLQ